MRLFTAIELPEPARLHLAERCSQGVSDFNLYLAKRSIDARLAEVLPANLHVTLKFLGDVDESAVPALCDALGRVTVERAGPVYAGHLELLPPRGPVRVVAAGLDGDVGRIERLHRAVEMACAECGFPQERRPFLPHITVARARDPIPHERRDRLKEALEPHFPGPEFAVDGFTLFESRLGRGAPTYVPLARYGAE
jgi:2'-5' RNA ligase